MLDVWECARVSSEDRAMINKVQSCHYTIVVAVIVIIFVLTTVTLFPFICNSPFVPDSDCQSSKNFHEKEGKLIEPNIVCNCDLPPINHSDSVPQSTGHVVAEDKNYAVIFTGRWKFLRFLIPYLVQSLRMNGGVIDKIVFMMILYDAETHNSLLNFAKVSHDFLGKNVFEFEYLGYEPGKVPQNTRIYRDVYYNLFSRLIEHPYDKYFKLDNDIVYIHPGTFKHMIENKNSSHCLMHFANIVCNWRCNYMHMEMGVFDEEGLNPRGLKFDFDPIGKCGWESPECAQLCLRTFLHHYHNERLDKYMFKGLKQLTKRKRFSAFTFTCLTRI